MDGGRLWNTENWTVDGGRGPTESLAGVRQPGADRWSLELGPDC